MKKFKLLIVIISIPIIFLTGCVYINTEIDINEDGSGVVTAEAGLSKEILDHLNKKVNDFTSKKNEFYLLKDESTGKEYYAEKYKDMFINPEELNWTTIGSISREMGPISLIPIDNGYRLNIKVFDEYGPENKAKHILPKDIKNIKEKDLENMDFADLIAQDVDGLVFKLTFNMPYDVKQTLGNNEGILISENTVVLDYPEMINSGEKEWEFESIREIKQDIFFDVKYDAWYAKAINSIAAGGLVNGFEDGSFRPNKNLTLAELCKVIYVGLEGENENNNSGYWAKSYIDYAKHIGYININSPTIKENWNIPATREQTVYAITRAVNKKMGVNDVKAENIKDWNQIDPDIRDIILWAYSVGVVNGRPDGTFGPKDNITRAEFCQILYNVNWVVPKSKY